MKRKNSSVMYVYVCYYKLIEILPSEYVASLLFFIICYFYKRNAKSKIILKKEIFFCGILSHK